MPRNRVKNKVGGRCNYEPEQLFKAIEAVKSGMTQFKAANKFAVPRGTLADKLSGHSSLTSVGGGRKQTLSKKDEQFLAIYLKTASQCGEGLTRDEIKDLVQEFVKSQKLKTRFKNDRPGDDWLASFMKRNTDLSWRKGERLSKKRFKGSDPFIVYRFYDDVEQLYRSSEYIQNDGNLIYNCDETAFCHDPSEFQVASPKGLKRVSLNIAGSGKKNTTVLACCSASGIKLPPFIIFKGKNVQSTWHTENAFPGTVITASERGWMEGSLFSAWFSRVFIKNIPSVETRNERMVTLFFDGCKSHITLSLVKEAKKNNVHLVKLPANLTHYLQPLDKTCFSAIKTEWNKEILLWQREHRTSESVPNNEFIKCLTKVWNKAFTSENIISGFVSTGLFPINRDRFPVTEFDPDAMKRYEEYKRMMSNQPVCESQKETVGPPTILNQESTTTTANLSLNHPGLDLPLISMANQLPCCHCINQPSTSKAPDNVQHVCSQSDIKNRDIQPQTHSFESFIKSHISKQVRGHVEKPLTEPKPKRKKITKFYGEILTMGDIEERLAETEKKAIEAQRKKEKSQSTTKQTKKKQKIMPIHDSSSSENEETYLCDDNSDDYSEGKSSDDEQNADENGKLDLKLESYYAVFYDSKWYLGRIIAINGQCCTIKFLEEDLNDSFIWPKHDAIEEVDKKFVFYGPIKLQGNGPFLLQEGAKIRSAYRIFKQKIMT